MHQAAEAVPALDVGGDRDDTKVGPVADLWVPENRSWVLSCEFVGEVLGPR